MKHLPQIIFAFSILVFSACTKDVGPLPVLTPGCNTSGIPNTVTITVSDFQFTPASVSCCVGDTIKWVWSNGSHTTTSVTIPTGAATWDQVMDAGNTIYKYKVTVPGTYNYQCTPHLMQASFTANP
jgi:plastocyanin